MAEHLARYLVRDLRESLARGAARDAAISPDGGRWLGLWALGAGLSGLVLLACCGYHAGFGPLNSLATRAPEWVWEWLTVLGDERVAFALTLFFSRRHPRVFWTLITAAVVATAYTHSLKALVGALRPPAVLDPDSFHRVGPGHRRGSFPSGHTTTAAVFFGVWVYYLRESLPRAALVGLAVAAGLSRVVVGVHWPLDVMAGMTGGVLSAWAGVALARRSMWGILRPSVHLTFVLVAVIMAANLLYRDAGYEKAAVFQQLLGTAALVYALRVYLIRPIRNWRRSRTPAR